MNVKRFTARTAREALALVREALGEDAVVLSTKPGGEGVEVLALAPDGLARLEQAAALQPAPRASAATAATAATVATATAPAAAPRAATLAERIQARGERLDERPDPRLDPRLDNVLQQVDGERSVAQDVETLGMSTLTFQDYVRERMLKRREAELAQQAPPPASVQNTRSVLQAAGDAMAAAAAAAAEPRRAEPVRPARAAMPQQRAQPGSAPGGTSGSAPGSTFGSTSGKARREPPVLRDEVRLAGPGQHDVLGANASLRERGESLGELRGELRSVRDLIEERFGMLAFMERLQRDPRQATLSQKLFDAGLSPALVRKLVQGLPADGGDELAWAAEVLSNNLITDEHELPLEDHDGVLALIGPTGVGKTTSTAKLAAAFAAKHGAANLGLITLDAYRVAAHEQLRTYGRILGVPVHTAHDRASLEDLLELLSAKKLVLIDTAGMAQRDVRTRELLEMLQHRSISKLLVINAAAQGETVEDVMVAYGVQQCLGVIVSKLDEAVKLGPALDALIRHRAKVVGVANGQRVPEDWHRLSAQALVQRALRGGGSASWKLDAAEVNLVFAAIHGAGYPQPQAMPSALPLGQ